MVTTAGDLITLALRAAGITGVGQTPIAEDFNDALFYLSSMVGQWQRKRWLVPSLVDYSITSTGAVSYTVGPTGSFVMPRPDRIESAFVRLLPTTAQPIDYPIAIIEAREDYNEISFKGISSFPQTVFYDAVYPTGNVFWWPVPVANLFQLHLTVKSALPVYTALTDLLALPPEYNDILLYGMVLRLCLNYGQTPNPGHVAAYRAALNTVRTANAQIKVLEMPPELGGVGTGDGVSMVGTRTSAFVLDVGVVL